MKYLSTRGEPAGRSFSEILLEGLAPDGGLYLPERYPQVDAATLARWRGLPYAELAFEILSLYIDDIPAGDLRALLRQTYTAEVFGTRAIVPLRPLEPGVLRPRPVERADAGVQGHGDAVARPACSSTSWRGAAARSTSSARPPATPAAPPNTRCAASAASASSCSRRTAG